MKKNTLFTLMLLVAAAAFSGCQAGAKENTPTANNTNTAKRAGDAPAKEDLAALDRQATQAFINGDGKFFEDSLSDKFVSYDKGQTMNKAELVKMITETKCDVQSWSLDDNHVAMVDPDTAVHTYRATFDGTCSGADGKGMKLPSPVRAASIYVRSGDKWLGAYHAETLIIDPTSPAPTTARAPARKPVSAATNPLTDTLMALETKGWEAWKARDPDALGALMSNDISFVNPIGTYYQGKPESLKAWTEPKCDIKSVRVADGNATSLSPTVAILTYKGTADGTCDGQKIGALSATTVFVKEGDAWKAAFIFESPA